MGNGFRPNYVGLGEVLCGPEMQADMKRRAGWVAMEAEATAPVGPADDPHRGEYRDSFYVSSGVETDAKGTRRAYGRVTNSSGHAVAVEYGRYGRSKGPTSSAHHTMLRALDQAGG